jgi:hypothetical protein
MANHDFTGEHRQLLATFARQVSHMRQQALCDRLCLVFGAGAGYDLGFPQWKTLLDRLGEGLEGYDTAQASAENEVALAQLISKLFQFDFEKRTPPPPLENAAAQKQHEAKLNKAWRDRIYDALYRDVETTDESAFTDQPSYYSAFIDVIKRSSVTITYNFDNSIERFLAASRSASEKTRRRGYTTIYDENSQLPAIYPIIYHPNGFLAHIKNEKPSVQLTLSEVSFTDQLDDSIAGRHAVLYSELTQKTCLFIGCSLSDPTLSYLLKRNARHHPGHYHYFVYWTGPDGENSPCSEAFSERLFDLYNLITLNLSTKELLALGDLLSYGDDFLLEVMRDSDIDGMFTYIVTGAVGSGKSSVISHFRSLKQHDEWLEPRLEGMEKDVELVEDERVRIIDQWVDSQFALKNRVLYSNENAIGIHILDRGPLDPLAFTKDGKLDRRAKRLKNAICKKSKLHKEIVPAHVIILQADPIDMETRAVARGKDFSADSLSRQQSLLQEVYSAGAGVSVIDTRGLSVPQVVRRVAQVIHRAPYLELNLTARVDELQTPQGQFQFEEI